MQNALNTVGPVDQAKRSVLHRLVSHGSGANLCSSYSHFPFGGFAEGLLKDWICLEA
jgi:hypothetical protein